MPAFSCWATYFAYQTTTGSASGRFFGHRPKRAARSVAIDFGLRRVHHNGHIAELLFTFGLVFIMGRGVQMTWGGAADAVSGTGLARFPIPPVWRELSGLPRLHVAGFRRHAACDFAAAEKTRIGLIIQARDASGMVSPGYDVPLVFTTVFAGGSFLRLAGVIAGNYLTTDRRGRCDGATVFVVVIFGGLDRWPAVSSPPS